MVRVNLTALWVIWVVALYFYRLVPTDGLALKSTVVKQLIHSKLIFSHSAAFLDSRCAVGDIRLAMIA